MKQQRPRRAGGPPASEQRRPQIRTSLEGAEVRIEKLVAEGNALAHLADGRVVLVRGAVPGDRVALEHVTERKGLVLAEGFRLLERSEQRVTPRCPVFDECGGCDWMMIGAEQQHAHKLALLREALLRTGKLDLGGRAIEIVASAEASGYRRRVRLQVADGRIGFHGYGSHVLVEPEHCVVSSAALNEALRELRLTSRARPSTLAGMRSLELREASDGRVSLYFERADDASRVPDLGPLRERFPIAVGAREAEAPSLWQRFELIEGTYLLAPPGCFTQVNWEINRALVRRVVDRARALEIGSFLDAYAGCGNFALPLWALGASGVAVESNLLATLAGREAAQRQGLPTDGFVSDDGARAARDLLARGRRFELVLLDPPRAGVKHGLRELASLASGWLAICSCNPATLARDLRALLDQGFFLEEITAFDMFPETHHLETLVWLRAPATGSVARGGARV